MRFISPKRVCVKNDFSRSTLDRKVAAGKFPQPVRISDRRLAFIEQEVDDWMAAQVAAARRGLVERGPCEVCGTEPAEGHHDDYDKPGVVRWLCRKHHKEHHARERKAG